MQLSSSCNVSNAQLMKLFFSQHFCPIAQARSQDNDRYILQYVNNESYIVRFSQYQQMPIYLSLYICVLLCILLFRMARYRHSVGRRGSSFKQEAMLVVEKMLRNKTATVWFARIATVATSLAFACNDMRVSTM